MSPGRSASATSLETYYRSSAETFMFSHGKAGKKQTTEEMTKAALEGLVKPGLISSVPDKDTIVRLSKIITKKDCCCKKGDMSEKIGEMLDIGYFMRQVMTEYALLISAEDGEFEESVKLQRELREVLRSLPRPARKAGPKKK